MASARGKGICIVARDKRVNIGAQVETVGSGACSKLLSSATNRRYVRQTWSQGNNSPFLHVVFKTPVSYPVLSVPLPRPGETAESIA